MPTIEQPAMNQALDAWAEQLIGYSAQLPPGKLALVGLIRRGDILARRLSEKLRAAGCPALCGALDISLYRDDWSMKSSKPALHSSYLPFSTDDMYLVIIDDVINTGRTIRAALNALFEYGRPAGVRLECLVDRGGRQLPIHPDYTAFTLDSPDVEDVVVHLSEEDGTDSISY